MASFGHTGGMAAYEDLTRQNLALFDRAMKMFSPFAYAPGQRPDEPAPTAATPPKSDPAADDALTALRKQMAEMQAQLDKLAKG